jgi:hypothetical protein
MHHLPRRAVPDGVRAQLQRKHPPNIQLPRKVLLVQLPLIAKINIQ